MLSTKLHEAINAQVNAELWSAYLYLAMSLDAEAKGHKGVANWFYVQFQEEQAHARIFMNYLNSRDAKVELLPIDPAEMYVALYADETVPYKEIVKVLNIANENQFKVVLATRRPDRQ
jgi:ferritin